MTETPIKIPRWLSYLNRYTELRMKPIQTANPKYVLAD